MNSTFSRCLFFSSVIVLTACGGGGGGDGDGSPRTEIVDEEGIRANIYNTNMAQTFMWPGIPYPYHDWDYYPTCEGNEYFFKECEYVEPPSWSDNTYEALKRWDIESEGLIPVKHNDVPEAIYAMDTIEAKLGKLLFDRNSILNTPDEEIERGIIASAGTALGRGDKPDSQACGHVGAVGGSVSMPSELWYDNTGNIFGPLQVNIGSDHPDGCTTGANLKKIAVHEFMHAIGFGAHFEGFGIGPTYDDNAWNALHNLYANQLLTKKEDLQITKKYPTQGE